MSLTKINILFPHAWNEIAEKVREMRDKVFAEIPSISAIDISDLNIPEDVLKEIQDKNRKLIRNEIPTKEIMAKDSPYVTDAFFDDQLLEVICRIHFKYKAEEFVEQLVRMIQKFLNESAALRGGILQERINNTNANKCISVIREALIQAKDDDERNTLELLVMDLTYGGEESWIEFLNPDLKSFVNEIVVQQE